MKQTHTITLKFSAHSVCSNAFVKMRRNKWPKIRLPQKVLRTSFSVSAQPLIDRRLLSTLRLITTKSENLLLSTFGSSQFKFIASEVTTVLILLDDNETFSIPVHAIDYLV